MTFLEQGYLIWRKLAFTCLLLSAPVLRLGAQNLEYRFINQGDALPHTIIYGITQDKSGFMWFASRGGLARYDGIKSKTYHHKVGDPNTVSSSDLSDIITANDGSLWIGTWGGGLNHFDPITETFTVFKHDASNDSSISGDFVQSLMEDDQGRIWIGTYRSGLNMLDPKTNRFRQWSRDGPEGLKHERIWNLKQGKDGTIWAATGGGLHAVDPETGQIKVFLPVEGDEKSLSHQVVISLALGEAQTLWVGTLSGLNRFNTKTFENQRIYDQGDDAPGFVANNFWRLVTAPDQSVWTASFNNGIKRYDPETGQFQRYKNNPRNTSSLVHNQIEALYIDNSNGLWIGTMGGGISRVNLNINPFLHYSYDPLSDNSLSHPNVSAFMEGQQNDLWIGTLGGGLNHLDRKTNTYTHYKHDPTRENSLGSDQILSMAGDSKDQIWLGFQDGTVDRFNPKTGSFRNYSAVPPGMKLTNRGIRVWTIQENRDGLLWIGHDLGLVRLDPETGTSEFFSLSESIFQPVFELFHDSKETTWVACQFGLFSGRGDLSSSADFNKISVVYKQNANHIPRIHDIVEDKLGTLWMATANGLAYIRSGAGQANYVDKQELQSQSIFKIQRDKLDNLWLTTVAAIYRYNPELQTLFRYNMDDGLQSNNINAQSFYKSSKGEFFIGGPSGFNSFFPEDIRINRILPQLALTGINLAGVPMPLNKCPNHISAIKLGPKHNVFSLEFAALNYNNPEKNRYLFMLDGFDKVWRSTEGQGKVTYTNLPPQDYVFRFKGSNNDGQWSPETRELAIQVTPPFIKTRLFYFLVAILLLFPLWFWNKIHQLQERKLSQTVEERTQSLREANERLEAIAGSLRRAQSDIIESAHRSGMAEVATDVLHTIGNALNSVHVSANMVESKLGAMRLDFLQNLVELLHRNRDNLPEFFAGERGRLIPEALERIVVKVQENRREISSEIKHLNELLFYINEVLVAQRGYAFEGNLIEVLDVKAMVEDVLRIQDANLEEFHISVIREYIEVPPIRGAKAVLLHIFNHLVKNACEALAMVSDRDNRILTLRIKINARRNIRLEVADNGIGIEPERQTLIFSHGFTNHQGKRGSLHYCANAISEMGGSIGVKSKGIGHGATFVLEIPTSPTSSEWPVLETGSER